MASYQDQSQDKMTKGGNMGVNFRVGMMKACVCVCLCAVKEWKFNEGIKINDLCISALQSKNESTFNSVSESKFYRCIDFYVSVLRLSGFLSQIKLN